MVLIISTIGLAAKRDDSNKVIPHDTQMIVLITNWISHSITHKIKRNALSRGIKVIYTPNGSQALQNRLQKLNDDFALGVNPNVAMH